jgi:beta-glucanase (GH16 family)
VGARQQLAAGLILLALSTEARSDEVLLLDRFDGGALDPVPWLLPEGPGTFFGRTQIRAPSLPPGVADGALRLALETHNPTALVPGDSFLGSEIRTRERFHPGDGTIALEARMRLVDEAGLPLPSGIVGALFLFETDGVVRDEIDVELLSRDLRLGLDRYLTNVFQDDPFDQAGRKAFASVDGLALGDFHRYRIEWSLDRILWWVDGVLVREVHEDVPDEPMDARLNVWVPDAGFAEAFDGSLQPVAEARLNETWFLEIDEVLIVRLPEPRGALVGWTALLAAVALSRFRFEPRSR